MDLEPGEQVIFAGHPSWRSLLGFYVTGLLLLVASGAAAAAATKLTEHKVDVAVVALVAGGVLVLVAAAGYLKRLFTRYTITDQRLHTFVAPPVARAALAAEAAMTIIAARLAADSALGLAPYADGPWIPGPGENDTIPGCCDGGCDGGCEDPLTWNPRRWCGPRAAAHTAA